MQNAKTLVVAGTNERRLYSQATKIATLHTPDEHEILIDQSPSDSVGGENCQRVPESEVGH